MVVWEITHISQLTNIESEGNRNTEIVFGSCPRILDSKTLPGQRTYQYEYDSAKRLIAITDPMHGQTQLLRDAASRVAALIDSNHNKTEFEYDEGGHLKTKRYADGSELNYQYEKGYIQTATNARGTVKTYRYNEHSQLTGIDYSDGTPSVSMSYDRFGRIKSVTDVQGKTVFQHKPNGLVSSIDGPLDNDTIELDYNSVGRLKSVQVGGDSHGAYQYDELGRLQSITAFGKEFSAVYNDAQGEVSSSLNYPNGITQTHRFDKAGDISLLEYTRGENQLSQFSYDFNVAGNITGITTNEGILFDSVRPKAGYNALNQIISWNGQSNVFDYDADGNLIAGLLPGDIPFEAEYDAENRLTSIRFSKQGKQIEERFTYNHQHMLVKYQRYEDNKLTNTKQFVRLGLIELQERDESGVILAQNVWRPDYPGGVGGLLLRKQGEEYQYFLTNHLGHVYGVFNQQGERIITHSYSPYGEVNGDSFQSQPFGLSTKRSDFESGLVYFGYRFYMPNLGRWLNRDPLHEQGGINLYAYVEGDPLGYVDPDGRLLALPLLIPPAKAIAGGLGFGLGVACFLDGLCNFNEEHDESGEKESSDDSGPKEARKKVRKGQGPCKIKRIDPPHGQPGSQWHAHGKNGGALNQDGTPKDGDPKFDKKTRKWLKDHGWKL